MKGRKGMFYSIAYSTYFIYGHMAMGKKQTNNQTNKQTQNKNKKLQKNKYTIKKKKI